MVGNIYRAFRMGYTVLHILHALSHSASVTDDEPEARTGWILWSRSYG